MSGKVVVTPRSMSARDDTPFVARLREAGYEVVRPSPGKQPNEDQLIEALRDAVGYIAGVEPITRRALEGAARLRAISRNGAGIDNIDMDATRELGITVVRAAGANARGVAELAIGLVLALFRQVPYMSTALKQGQWERSKGLELSGRTLGLIGCGKIGQEVGRLATGLDMQVLGYDPYPDKDFSPPAKFRYAELDEAVCRSDAVSLHCPPRSDRRPVLDADRVGAMKNGAVIVNTARAELVDTTAVLGALNDGRLRGFAVDVFEREPPEVNELLSHPRVIATPHVGGYTEESVHRASEAAVTNLIEELSHEPTPG